MITEDLKILGIAIGLIIAGMFVFPFVIWAIGRTWVRFIDWLKEHP